MQECPPLVEVASPCNMKCLLASAIETAQAYNDCRARHEALVKFNKGD